MLHFILFFPVTTHSQLVENTMNAGLEFVGMMAIIVTSMIKTIRSLISNGVMMLTSSTSPLHSKFHADPEKIAGFFSASSNAPAILAAGGKSLPGSNALKSAARRMESYNL